jgi:hypothetical protein
LKLKAVDELAGLRTPGHLAMEQKNQKFALNSPGGRYRMKTSTSILMKQKKKQNANHSWP